jgi:stage V sporulation protein SpoVS
MTNPTDLLTSPESLASEGSIGASRLSPEGSIGASRISPEEVERELRFAVLGAMQETRRAWSIASNYGAPDGVELALWKAFDALIEARFKTMEATNT